MMRALWISKTGMEAQQTQLDVVSHNLANVATNGFKKSHAVFEDLMYQSLRQTGAPNGDQAQLPTGLQVGLGVRTVATSRQFSQGTLQQTTNPLHPRRRLPGQLDRPAGDQQRPAGAARRDDSGQCAIDHRGR